MHNSRKEAAAYYYKWRKTKRGKAWLRRYQIKRSANAEWLEYCRLHSRKRHFEIRKFLRKEKLSCGCIDCGYKKNVDALQFDHVRGKKVANVSRLSSWNEVVTELKKCEVRCANCHAIVTAKRGRTKRRRSRVDL